MTEIGMTEIGIKLRKKSFEFALRIVKLARFLETEKKDWVLSRQILKSGTSIGANVRESRFAQSTADFVSKLTIALKEAEETEYWLELLTEAEMISEKQCASLQKDLNWIIATLVNSVKVSKRSLKTA